MQIFNVLFVLAINAIYSITSINSMESSSDNSVLFNFVCDNKNCPVGYYQDDCPLCSAQTKQGNSYGYLSCTCFDNSELQNVIIYNSLYKTCNPTKNNNQVYYDINTNSLLCKSNGSYKPHNPYPPGLVDFNFVCANTTSKYGPWKKMNNCPSNGNYKTYCPRCTLDSDNWLTCLCFNNNKQMISRTQYLNMDTCSKGIVNCNNGILSCS